MPELQSHANKDKKALCEAGTGTEGYGVQGHGEQYMDRCDRLPF